ncbi:unnamed protein product, partial [Staurois parvus]
MSVRPCGEHANSRQVVPWFQSKKHIGTSRAESSLSDVVVQKKCQGGREWEIRKALYKGSAGYRIGSALCRAVYRWHSFVGQCTGDNRAEDRGHCWQGRGQGSLLAGQRTGVTAGRAEDRGHCWQGRGQGLLLAGQRTGVTAGRTEDRGHCGQGTQKSSFSHPCTAHSLGTGGRAPLPGEDRGVIQA